MYISQIYEKFIANITYELFSFLYGTLFIFLDTFMVNKDENLVLFLQMALLK